jgi:hypothetical protein
MRVPQVCGRIEASGWSRGHTAVTDSRKQTFVKVLTMKKGTILLLTVVLSLLALVGCAQGPSSPTGTAAEIADKVFAASGVESFGMQQPLATDEEKTFFLGTSDYPAFADAVAVMPMISIDTRVMVVVKAADEGDVETIKASLEENIDPNRLVCVTFASEDVAIESRGDVILMTINTDVEQRTALVEAFKSID